MSIFSFLKPKDRGILNDARNRQRVEFVEARLNEYNRSFTCIKLTCDVDEFFAAYRIWLSSIEAVRERIPPNDLGKWCREYYEIFEFDSSESHRSKLQIAFMRRVLSDGGREHLLLKMPEYANELTDAASDFYKNNLGAIGPSHPQKDEMTFYRISFNYSEKTYYYIGDEEFAEGDEVLVPTGEEDKYSVGTVRRVEYHTPKNAPYPLSKIKKIIRKA